MEMCASVWAVRSLGAIGLDDTVCQLVEAQCCGLYAVRLSENVADFRLTSHDHREQPEIYLSCGRSWSVRVGEIRHLHHRLLER